MLNLEFRIKNIGYRIKDVGKLCLPFRSPAFGGTKEGMLNYELCMQDVTDS